MQIALKVVTGLIAAGLLVATGLALGIPSQYSGDTAGIWIFAAVLVALALAVQPPVGRRNPWVITGLVVLAGVSAFEVVNYHAWYDNREELLSHGLRTDIGGIHVVARKDWGAVIVPATSVSASGPLRLLTPEETPGVESVAEVGIDPGFTALVVRMPSRDFPKQVVQITSISAAVRRGLVSDDDYPDRFMDHFHARLSGDTTTISGRRFRAVLSNCGGEVVPVHANPALAGGDQAVVVELAPDPGPPPAGCKAVAARMPVDGVLRLIAAEREITVEAVDGEGATMLTITIPVQRLSEALKAQAGLADRIRRKDVGKPFSLFRNDIPAG